MFFYSPPVVQPGLDHWDQMSPPETRMTYLEGHRNDVHLAKKQVVHSGYNTHVTCDLCNGMSFSYNIFILFSVKKYGALGRE